MNATESTVRLGARDRAALLAHFVALDGEDRRLRFGASISDYGLDEYVARIHFERDGLFAVQDGTRELLAVVHVAITPASAELGLSVLPLQRGKGLGSALFARAVTHIRNRGLNEVFVHCISENAAMMHLARKHRMRLAHSGSESDGRLELAPATLESYVSEWLADQQGLLARVPAATTP